MPEMCLINRVQLVPVLAVDLVALPTDTGIAELPRLKPGSWHVATSDFEDGAMLERVLAANIASMGGVDALADPHNVPTLNGGLALKSSDGTVLIEPQCRSALDTVRDWQTAARYRGQPCQMLWIGHPWPSMRFEGERLILSDLHESGEPIGRWSILPEDLQGALAAAKAQLQQFARRIAPILIDLGFRGNAPVMAEKLAGLREKYTS